MSFKVFFDLSTGFKCDLYFRPGTFDRVHQTINSTERRLGIRREYYRGVCRWKSRPLVNPQTSDTEYCDAVEEHNATVHWFYDACCKATTKPTETLTEKITPKMAQNLFIGLRQLDVPPERWTREYYQARMDSIYETLRGRQSEGMSLNSDPLTIEQARDVIVLFSQYLDRYDIRLDVCRGEDTLTDSYSDGYFWCTKCGAVNYDDLPHDFDMDSELCDECAEKTESINTSHPQGSAERNG